MTGLDAGVRTPIISPILSSISKIFSGLSFFTSLGAKSDAVGLSIGSSSIKLVELRKSRKGWELVHFGQVQLPEEAVLGREIVNGVAVSDALRNLVGQLKLKSKNVTLGLSGASLMVRRFSLEVPNLKELEETVFWEAEQYLTFDPSDVVMDCQLLRKLDGNMADVMMVAVKASVLETYVATVESAGLKARVVDADFFALQNVFEANYPSRPHEATAVIDVGASGTKMVVIQDGLPTFTKDSMLAGRNLTAEIQRHMNLSYADAEALKSSGGMPQEVSEIVAAANDNLAGEIKKMIVQYAATVPGAPITSVVLAGGASRTPGLSQVVEEQVGVPTQLMNPFNFLTYDPAVFSPDYMAAIASVAAVPIGLALRAGT